MMWMNGENSGKIVEASLPTTKVCIQLSYLRTSPLEPSSSQTVAPVVLAGAGAVVAAFALLSPSALVFCFQILFALTPFLLLSTLLPFPFFLSKNQWHLSHWLFSSFAGSALRCLNFFSVFLEKSPKTSCAFLQPC